MATAKVLEMQNVAQVSGTGVPVGEFDDSATVQVITYTTSTQSAAFGANTKFVTVVAQGADAYMVIGTNPTATANSWLLKDGVPQSWAVHPGDKVAVYDGSS